MPDNHEETTYHVCPECEGKGVIGSGITFTEEEIGEHFRDAIEFDEYLHDQRRGVYDKRCPYCKGQRVVDQEKFDGWEDEVRYRMEVAAEQRYFGIR